MSDCIVLSCLNFSYFHFRPPEDFAQKIAETESISDMDEVDGVMPSFYKFCAKTATGVFDKTIHTIKTALPGTVQDVEYNDNAWIFLQNEQSVRLLSYARILFLIFLLL